ncbi:MAG: VWD domain-containing protein, partial [Ilumatobacter sp.]|nr:VWD domain-containing protein [Ilumatobacter sp.]
PPPPPPPPPGPGGGSSTGGAWGDPHMVQFDGWRYDSQTLGEYVYAEPVDGDPDRPRVIGRHEFARVAAALTPTALTALAVEFDGHRIEMYGRPVSVRIDDVDVDLPSGVSIRVSEFGYIRRSGNTYSFDHPSMSITASLGSYIDADITVVDDGTYVGMLGLADGDPTNDLLVRDPDAPIENWTTYELADVRGGHDPVIEIAESWRITDLADSPFGIVSDQFAAASPPRPGSELLEPYRVQARDMLAAVDAMCSAELGDSDYAIDVFAIELSIGNDPALLGCNYDVTGRVLTAGSALAVSGATVVVDGDGVAACTTTTDSTGGFLCRLAVDVDEVTATGAMVPIDVDIEVTPRGAATVTTTTTIDEAAPFNTRQVVRAGDIEVPVTSVAVLELEGTLSAFGLPYTATTTIRLDAIDADGRPVLGAGLFVDPDGAGRYATEIALPLDVDSATVTWNYGQHLDPRSNATFTDLVAGANARTFDASYDPVVLTIGGTALYNGVAPDRATISVVTTRSDGATVTRQLGVTPDLAGAYTADIVLPLGATAVELRSSLGSSLNTPITTGFDPPDAGPASVTFDIVVDAPALSVTGTAHRNGSVLGPTIFAVTAQRPSGPVTSTRWVRPDATTGEYAFVVDLPADATSATVRAEAGVTRAGDPTATKGPLVPGVNDLTFGIDVGTPILALTGVVTAGGAPWTSQVAVAISSGGYSVVRNVTPDATGSYGIDLELPAGSTTADVTIRTGYTFADWSSATFPDLVDGPNPVELDASFDAVVVGLSGELSYGGSPLDGPVDIMVVGFDTAGFQVASRTVRATADAGAYEGSTFFPPTVENIQVWGLLGRYPSQRPVQEFDGLVVGANAIDFDEHGAPKVLDVGGVFTSGGSFVPGPLSVVVTSTGVRRTGQEYEITSRPAVFASFFDGRYEFVLEVPEEVVSSTLVAEIGPVPEDYPTLTVDPLTPGTNVIDFSGSVALPVRIAVRAVLADGNGPATAPTQIRTVVRDGDGLVLSDLTSAVTPDAGGVATIDLEVANSAASVEVSQLVGVPGEIPPSTTFTGLVPGDNDVTFLDVYDPPVATLTGTATRNGAALDSISVSWAVTDGALGATTFTDTVTPDPVDGGYTIERPFPRDTTAVTVTVTAGTGDPTTTVSSALADGPNAITADLISERPDVTLTGVVLLGGVPPTGNVAFDVTRRGAGHADETVTVFTNPDDVDGSYELDLGLLPYWTTDIDVVARVGGSTEAWPTGSFSVPTGPSTVDFDAIADVQVLNIAGTITLGTTPYPLPFYLQIQSVDAGGTPFASQQVTVTPDANGEFSFERVYTTTSAAQTTVTARFFGFGGPSDQATFTSLTPGRNDLDFDPVVDQIGVVLSGTLLDRGEPETDDQPITLRYTNASGTVLTSSTAIGTTPDETGAYTSRLFLFPPDTVKVEVGTRHVTLGNDEVWQTYDSLVHGFNEVTFSEDYVPPVLRISGTMFRDDAPITVPTSLRIAWRQRFESGGVYSVNQTVTVTPDAAGAYSIDVVGPRMATDITVTPQIGVTPADTTTTSLDPLLPGLNTVTVDVDYHTTTLSLAGTLGYHGAPPPAARSASIVAYDVGGGSLGTVFASFVPDPTTGAYTWTGAIPSASESVRVTLMYGPSFSSYERFDAEIDTTPGTTTAATFDAETTSIDVAGLVSLLGLPSPDRPVDLTVDAYDGTSLLDTLSITVDTDGDGEFWFEEFLPLGTDRVVLTSDVPGADPFELTDVVTPGHTSFADVVFDGTSSGITISGLLTEYGGATVQPYTPELTVHQYSMDFDAWSFISSSSMPISYDTSTREFSGTVDAEDDVAIVVVDVYYPFDDVTYTYGFDLRSMEEPYQLELDVDHSATRLVLTGTSVASEAAYCNAGQTMMFEATVEGYEGGLDGSHLFTYTTVVVPDPVTGYYEVRLPLTGLTDAVVLSGSTSNIHNPFWGGASQYWGLDGITEGDTYVDFTWGDTWCAI